MRDFNSSLRKTPFLDKLRNQSIFIPMGRGQGHNQFDSITAEITGMSPPRLTNSVLLEDEFQNASKHVMPEMIHETLEKENYGICTHYSTAAFDTPMEELWLKNDPDKEKRIAYKAMPRRLKPEPFIEYVRELKKPFYAHIFLRDTHRPWGQAEELLDLMQIENKNFNGLIAAARRASLEKKEEFIKIRLKGLENADKTVKLIYESLSDIEDTVFVVYSNHGEVFDHYQGLLPFNYNSSGFPYGTTHGPSLGYECLYANMQMWVIPGYGARVMSGIGLGLDYAPTIRDLAGLPHEHLDGNSMLPYFKEGRFPKRTRWAEGMGCVTVVNKDNMKMLATSGGPHGKMVVFDLNRDPWEYHNIKDTPEGKDLIKWAVEAHKKMKLPEILEN